eukprot:2629730-Pleurochrysis_carterae.AAC.2
MARRSGSCCASGRGRASYKVTTFIREAHNSGLGVAEDSQGQARREACKARSEGLRARANRRAAAGGSRALLFRPKADGRGGPAGPATFRTTNSWASKTGFARSLPNVPHCTLLLEADEDTNDLKDGDSGFDSRSVRDRVNVLGRKRRRGLRSLRVDREGGEGGDRGRGYGRQGGDRRTDGLRQPAGGPRRSRRGPLPHRVAGLPIRHGVSLAADAAAAAEKAPTREDAELIDLEESD